MRSSRRSDPLAPRAAEHRRLPRLLLEALEPRAMLAASPLAANVVCSPNLSFFAGSGFSVYSPNQIRHAYGFDQVSWNGAGQTIAIVDAYDDPTVLTDLQKFDRQWGLADPRLTVAKMTSGGRGPAANSGWAMEIALDVEWAHAIAPGANILLVEATTASLGDLLSAVNYARNQVGVSVVSMSWGAGEFSGEGYYDSYFTTPSGHSGVTFIASSGDSGAPASWPSISSNVLAVGGTTLTLGTGSVYGGEKGWSGSGGGYSPYESEPSYQRAFQNTGHRSNPDVAYDADPYSGFYVCDNGGWYAVGGTSAGAPQWAALIAIANQGRAVVGKAPLSSALQAVYSLAGADFHDVTTGSNGYSAGAGYDPVTGRGSPVANLVIRDLVAYGAVTTNPTTSTLGTLGTQTSIGRSALTTPVSDGGWLNSGDNQGFSITTTAFAGEQSGKVSLGGSAIGSVRSAGDRWSTTGWYNARLNLSDAATAESAGSDDFHVQDSTATRTNSLPEAVFEGSRQSTDDPFGTLDRVERLLDRYLGPESMLATGDGSGFNRDGLDACLADEQWLANGDVANRKGPEAINRTNRGTMIPLAALTLGGTIEISRTRIKPQESAVAGDRKRRF
jgi:subtilase family serine protease